MIAWIDTQDPAYRTTPFFLYAIASQLTILFLEQLESCFVKSRNIYSMGPRCQCDNLYRYPNDLVLNRSAEIST